MGIVLLLIIGAAAGFLATRILKLETNIAVTVAIGVLGALIGGFVLKTLLLVLGLAAGFIGALLGSLVLVWIYKTYFS